jgi:flagellar biosynthesis protein FlhG
MSGNLVAVSSGKGGVGKTSLTVNLAVALAATGKKVLVCDGDLGLANVDITFGLKPQFDLQHVLSGERTLDQIVIEGPQGVGVIPAASGISKMLELSPAERLEMGLAFTELSRQYDVVLLDTAAGIGHDVISFLAGAHHVIVVVCDEPTSLTDAYALIKVSASERKVRRFQIVANKVKGNPHGLQVYKKLLNATDQFLDVNLSYLGAVPTDHRMLESIRERTPVVSLYPRTQASVAIREIAASLEGLLNIDFETDGIAALFQQNDMS